MAYWLIKTEPNDWSWEQQEKAGSTHWDGVRNYQARNNMQEMKLGDKCFFYRSVKTPAVVGVVEVVKLFYPDPTDKSGRFGMVDVKTVKPMKSEVPLKDIKATPELSEMRLMKQSRLSVSPVTAAEWKEICKMGGV